MNILHANTYSCAKHTFVFLSQIDQVEKSVFVFYIFSNGATWGCIIGVTTFEPPYLIALSAQLKLQEEKLKKFE